MKDLIILITGICIVITLAILRAFCATALAFGVIYLFSPNDSNFITWRNFQLVTIIITAFQFLKPLFLIERVKK